MFIPGWANGLPSMIMYHTYGTHPKIRRICGNNLTGYSPEKAYIVYIVYSITADLWLKVPEYQ